MHGRGWFLRTGSIAAATGLLVAIVVATTVGASPLYLLQSTYKADEGVFWTYKGGPVELAATPKKVASLKPPPGSYMVVAKLWADPAPSAGGKMNVFARCLLLA